ncbi:MAG: hypothetical protein A2Z32_08665 [Chloroflexi bacterium RBG_16_69_14]|nr:MAG: hypothetical protein A2Z32_08665 [Chloroflexi bacterium RBG_16_69_14]
MTDWAALTKRTLAGIETCEPIYRPTNFWGPGVARLLDDLDQEGLKRFKSWPRAAIWFYPTYGKPFGSAAMKQMFDFARSVNPLVEEPWFRATLSGGHQARRDFDAVRLVWDQARWPFDLETLGESKVGKPPQHFHLIEGDREAGWTRPYLNYLLCLAALSRHVSGPPRSFLEIGGGYGVLGEIVLSRDPDGRYVNVDLPPLTTVSSYYLDALFGDRITVYDDAIDDTGPVELSGSASLPNWRIGDIAGPFDVFVNSFSFQEMEPDVVERYISDVAAKEVDWVVSLNSKTGKRKATEGDEVGVIEPVTSDRIVALFEARGYDLVARYGDPIIQSAGELVIVRRRGVATEPALNSVREPLGTTVDLRRNSSKERPPSSRLAGFARDWLPPKLLQAVRRARR